MSKSDKPHPSRDVDGPTTFTERHGGVMFAGGMIVLLGLLILLNAC